MPSASRTVRCGSSTSTVLVPTSIVSHRARSRWVSSRAAGLETQRLVPSAAALRPSSVVANFQVTNGRPCSTAKVQTRLSARASSAEEARSRPRRRRPAGSRRHPAATGLASRWATTTRRTPAATSAREQGPVRPVWLHGSSVTTAVAPRAAPPTRAQGVDLGVRRAGAAVVTPRRWCGPSASSRTQPTRGFGPRGTPSLAASVRARRIAARSVVAEVRSRCAPPVRSRTPGQRRCRGSTPARPIGRRSRCVRFPSGL